MAPELSLNTDPGQTDLDSTYARLRQIHPDTFVEYDENLAEKTLHYPLDNPAKVKGNVRAAINTLLDGEKEEVILPSSSLNTLTREEIAYYETQGIIIDGITKERPLGGVYVKDLAPPVATKLSKASHFRTAVEKDLFDTLVAVRATGVLRGVTALITGPTSPGIPEDISGLPSIPVDSLCAAVYKEGEWSETNVFPHGKFLVEGVDNTSFQYAQSVFEGIKIKIGPDGKIYVFRLKENAARLAKSCIRDGMPPVSMNQFMKAVITAVKANIRFIPPAEDGSLYVRPYVVGLSGGTGAKPATEYLFAVQVSPFGKYLKPGADNEVVDEKIMKGIKVKAVVCPRGEAGRDKASANYAIMFALKKEAKLEHFDDILLMEHSTEAKEPEEDKQKLFATECGTSNFFTIDKEINEDETIFHLSTTTLMENILPGITRKSLIQLLKDPKIQEELGCKVIIHDDGRVMVEDIAKAKGAFSTGTAAGINNIGSITIGREKSEYTDRETQEFIKKLFDLLTRAITGQLPGYEHWVTEI